MKGKVAAGSGLNLVRYAKELSLEEPEPKAEAEKWRRTYVTITRGGQTVAVINGAADSWEIIEAKAMEHHPGTREWVFREVNAFIDLTDAGERVGRAMAAGLPIYTVSPQQQTPHRRRRQRRRRQAQDTILAHGRRWNWKVGHHCRGLQEVGRLCARGVLNCYGSAVCAFVTTAVHN